MASQENQLTKKERKELKKQQKAVAKKKADQQAFLRKAASYAVIVGVVSLTGWFIYNRIVPVPEKEKNKPVDQVMESDWVLGNSQAKVVIIEYSDFQCPACASYVEVVHDLVDAYENQVAVVYRHNPLKQIHAQAELAAQATEAAGKQGKFWEMHDMVFERQSDWAENRGAKRIFVQYAEELGLDVNQFKANLSSKETRGLVKADYMSALENQLYSTPRFFVNGELIKNPAGLDEFKQVVDASLPATESAEINEVE